jgi:predicted Zn-dependent protease
MFGKRLFRIVSILVVVALLGIIGYIGYQYFLGGSDKLLLAAEKSYAKGLEAMQAGDPATAAKRFEEAELQAGKVFDRLEVERKSSKNTSGEAAARIKEIDGKAFWTRTLAIRDGAYARAAAEGKPIADLHDATTGEKYRSINRIPDDKVKAEAIANLRAAATRLPKSPEVLTECLRTELLLQPLSWGIIEPVCRQLAAQEGKADARVLYMLAKHEYEQPTEMKTGLYLSSPVDKRSRERMLKARDYLAQAKAAQGYRLWRSLHLEAQIAAWLRATATNSKKTAEAQKEDANLRAVLLDDQTGAIHRAEQGQDISPLMSTWDIEGLQESLLMALDLTLEDIREKRADPSRVELLYDRLLRFCQKSVEDRKEDKVWLGEMTQLAVEGVARVEPFVTDLGSTRWQQRLEGVQNLTRKAMDQKLSRFDLYEKVAQLLARQAHVHARRGDRPRQAILNEQVTKWIEDSLRLGEETKAAASRLSGLHALSAELKAATGAKRADLQTSFEALRGQSDERSIAMANLLEGVVCEREGRLDKARQMLEKVTTAPAPDLALRAHMVLANIYLAIGQPESALQSLKQFEKIYDHFEQLTPQEKAWVYEFLRTPEDLAYLNLIANLEVARQKIVQHLRDKPKEQVPADLVKTHEQTAARMLQSLKPPSPHDRAARQAVVTYHALTARREAAIQLIQALQKDYPDSLEALQLEVAILVQPERGPGTTLGGVDPQRVALADQRIQSYVAQYPNNLQARLFWANWLQRTGRADQSVAYLENRSNFPGVQDDTYKQVLASAYIRKGERDEAIKLLQHLPQSAGTDATLIGLAGSRQEQEKMLEKALARHERSGMLRCYEAAMNFQKGSFEEAANQYFQALEYTRFRSTAAQGLQRSLFALSNKDPRKARDLAMKLFGDMPTEASLLLPIAYASLLVDELGEPTDAWPRTLSMASALNHWEQLVKDEPGRDLVSVPLTRAEFWGLANRVEIAHREIVRALARDPQNERALRAATNIGLTSGDPDLMSKAESHLATLRQQKPDDIGLMLQQARIEEIQGRTTDAMKTYEKVLEKNPKYGPAYGRLAVLAAPKDRAGALTWIKKWQKELPDDLGGSQAEVWHLALEGKIPEARQLAETMIKARVKKFADELAARKPPAGTDPKEWEKQIQKAIDDAPLELAVRFAQAFGQAQAWDEAEVWVKRVLDKRPDAELVLLIMGDIHVARKAWQPAVDAYAKVLAKNKDNAVAANNSAWVLAAKLNKPDEAYQIIQSFCLGRHSQKKMAGDRLRPEFLDTLGVIYQKLGKPELYPEMRDLFEAARKRYPSDPRVYLYLGNAYASLQERNKAQEMFLTATALSGPTAKNSLSVTERQEVLDAVKEAQKKLQ